MPQGHVVLFMYSRHVVVHKLMNNIVLNNFSGVFCQRQTCCRDGHVNLESDRYWRGTVTPCSFSSLTPPQHQHLSWLTANFHSNWRSDSIVQAFKKPGRLAAEVRHSKAVVCGRQPTGFCTNNVGRDRVSCCVSWLVLLCICFGCWGFTCPCLTWFSLLACSCFVFFSHVVELITSCCSHLP